MQNTKDLLELGKRDPKEAHRLVSRMANQRPFFEFKGRQSCLEKAMKKPLPGNAADAFLNGALKVNGRKVYEVVPTHIKCLQGLNSPLLKMGEKASSNPEKKSEQFFEDNEEWELCYIFTQEPKSLRLNLKDKGIEYLKKQAEELIADGVWTAAEINTTVLACIAQYARFFQTTVKFTQEMEGSGDTTFFRELMEKASTTEALGG